MARTRLTLTLRSGSPPPTEKISTQSRSVSRLPASHLASDESQPSSLIRAVNSETLSTGVYASRPAIFRKSFTACEALAALPPTPRMKSRPPAARTSTSTSRSRPMASRPIRPAVADDFDGQVDVPSRHHGIPGADFAPPEKLSEDSDRHRVLGRSGVPLVGQPPHGDGGPVGVAKHVLGELPLDPLRAPLVDGDHGVDEIDAEAPSLAEVAQRDHVPLEVTAGDAEARANVRGRSDSLIESQGRHHFRPVGPDRLAEVGHGVGVRHAGTEVEVDGHLGHLRALVAHP